MGGIVDRAIPREIKKPFNKLANKFGDAFVPKELAKPLMLAGAFIPGPLGYAVSAAGQGKEYGKLDYDALAMQVLMNQTMNAPAEATGPAFPGQGSGAMGPVGGASTSLGGGVGTTLPGTTGGYTTPATGNYSTYIPSHTAPTAPAGGTHGTYGGTSAPIRPPSVTSTSPGFFRTAAEGVGDIRNTFLGDPRDRMLFDSTGNFAPGSSWQSMGNPFKPGPMTDAEKAAFQAGIKDVGIAGTTQVGMMEQKEIMEDIEKDKERDEARNRAYWQNYFAGIERYRPYRTGEMGDEMDALYAQYGAADEYDPYHGMRDAYAGTYFDEDRWYRSYKKGGRVDYAGGGNPHRDIAKPIRPGGLNNLMRKYKEHLAKIENKKRANIRERSRVGLALGGNDEVGGLSSLTSEIPQNVPGVPNGMQIDARRPGGTYIDAGTKPKADDVAAMLSEGEFVITKDGMEGFDLQTGGPGDSRSGAKKMYAQMNEWETVAAQAGV